MLKEDNIDVFLEIVELEEVELDLDPVETPKEETPKKDEKQEENSHGGCRNPNSIYITRFRTRNPH